MHPQRDIDECKIQINHKKSPRKLASQPLRIRGEAHPCLPGQHCTRENPSYQDNKPMAPT